MKNKNILCGLILGLLMLAGALPAASAVPPAIHFYELNGDLLDTFGGPALVSEGGTIGAATYEFGPNQGLTLPASVLADPGQYSIEMLMQLDALAGPSGSPWVKLIDFKNLSDDNGLYAYDGAATVPNGSIVQFYPIGGTEDAFFPGELVHVVITRDASSKEVSVFALGVGQFTFEDSADWGIFDSTDNIMRFLQDDDPTGNSEASSGAIDFIRIYNPVLTAEDVAELNEEANSGQLLFEEDFEDALSPSDWAANASAQITPDPLRGGNNVGSFGLTIGGGDLRSVPITTDSEQYVVRFEFLGVPGSDPSSGGCIGYNNNWRYCSPGWAPQAIPDDAQWNVCQFEVPSNYSVIIYVEDFWGSGAVAGNAYFDNIQILQGSGEYCELAPPPADTDGDGVLDEDDVCPGSDDNLDVDFDGVPDGCDNCPVDANTDQADEDIDGIGDVCDNTDPVADCAVDQLTAIGDEAEVSLSGAGSSDAEDANADLTFDWTINDGTTVLNASGESITEDLGYGDYLVTLTVTDTEGASDTCTTNVTLNPADLAVFDCEKIEVKFCLGDADSDSSDDDSSADDGSSGCTSDRVKIKGEIGLPMGVDYAALAAQSLVVVDMAGDLLPGGSINLFEVDGGHSEHWKYSADGPGLTKLEIDWKGARFKYKEPDVPVEFESELITPSETVLEMKYDVDDAGGAFTVDIDGTELVVDADGVVSAPGLAAAIEVKKTGEKVTVTLPFPLLESSSVLFGGALTGSVDVAAHYTHSVGRFKLEAESGSTLELGASTLPRVAGTTIGVGGPLYTGSCGAGADELKVHSRKWKAKK